MIKPGKPGHAFTVEAVMELVPEESGVYAICNQKFWIYVGEGPDMRGSLLSDLRGENPCIVAAQPTGFQFEPLKAEKRLQRQSTLIAHLQPLCNQKFR